MSQKVGEYKLEGKGWNHVLEGGKRQKHIVRHAQADFAQFTILLEEHGFDIQPCGHVPIIYSDSHHNPLHRDGQLCSHLINAFAKLMDFVKHKTYNSVSKHAIDIATKIISKSFDNQRFNICCSNRQPEQRSQITSRYRVDDRSFPN